MSDPRLELVVALREALLADATIAATSGVFDRVPRAVAHPFLTFGEMTSEPLDGDAGGPVAHRLDVRVHSRAEGRREASELADRVRAALDAVPRVLANHRVAALRVRDVEVRSARDQRSFQARVRLRAVTEAI